jgi:hypothetical protein
VIAELDDAKALATLGTPLASWSEEVIPDRFEPHPTSTYSPQYAWMFAYEKGLRTRIEGVLSQPLSRRTRSLFGPDGAFSEALSNAFLHGHRRANDLPISVRCTVATHHLYFSITDRGPGFDVARVLTARGRHSAYYHVAGNGLRCIEETPWVTAWWADGGRTMLLLAEMTG